MGTEVPVRLLLRLVIVVLAFGAVLLGGLTLIPAERAGEIVSRQIAQTTGRAITFEEGLRPMLWPTPGVQTGAIRLDAADWAREGPLLSARGLRATLEPAALLRGEVVLREIALERPRLVLERAADGRTSWEGGAPGASGMPGAGAAGGQPLALPRIGVEEAEILWVDHGIGRRLHLTGARLELDWPAPRDALSLSLSGQIAGQALRGSLRAGNGEALVAGDLTSLVVELEGGFGRVFFEGRAGHGLPSAEGRLALDLRDLPALARLADMAPPALPAPFDRSLALSGTLTVPGPQAVFLRGLQLSSGGNRIEGDADLTLSGERPLLRARLSAGPLALGAAGGPGAGAGGEGTAAQGWSEARIDASALALLDADVTLAAPSVILGGQAFAPVDLRAALDRARLVTTFRELGVHGGRITGEFVINNRSGLSVGGNLAAENVALREALTAWAGYDRLSGSAGGSLRFLGVGPSVAAIMASLSGEAALRIGPGELRGVDLAATLRGATGEGRTVFDGVTAGFVMERGVARNDDLALTGPVIGLTGRGSVDLGGRSLDYRLTPVTLGGERIGGAMAGIGLRASGPWHDVRLSPDLSGAAGERLEQEREALRERVEGAIEERLREVLPETGEGLSPEEALRRRLEEEAQRQLLRLLGRGE